MCTVSIYHAFEAVLSVIVKMVMVIGMLQENALSLSVVKNIQFVYKQLELYVDYSSLL